MARIPYRTLDEMSGTIGRGGNYYGPSLIPRAATPEEQRAQREADVIRAVGMVADGTLSRSRVLALMEQAQRMRHEYEMATRGVVANTLPVDKLLMTMLPEPVPTARDVWRD
jgi:hypothetical protein